MFSNHLNLKNKITNTEQKKIFCSPSKTSKNISRPINICLKYFINPTKTIPPPFLHAQCTVPKETLEYTLKFLSRQSFYVSQIVQQRWFKGK